jgi:DNA (cytosine-5)-methyltransferase 1
MTATAIDLFAGAGGFTTGAEAAGLQVLWAANHWPAAVEAHRLNHPGTVHACQDLQQADFRQAPAHDVLLASPSCTGHTPARGRDLPRHDAARSTAWAVVTAAEVHRAPLLVVENVPAFRAWVLYPAWRAALEALGYALAEHVLDAAHHGVPQHRERLFVVATRSRAPLQLHLEQEPLQPIGPHLQWDAHRWSEVDRPGRAAATLARVARGRREVGAGFVMPYYGSGSGETGRSLGRPLGTVTTRDRWAVVDGGRMRMLQPPEYAAAMGFSADYQLPPSRSLAIHLLGNAVCPPVAERLLRAALAAA